MFGKTDSSAINEWPTVENPSNWKINSISVELRQEKITYERYTYSFLEWVGDVGGVADGLYFSGYFLMQPFAIFAVKAELLYVLFKQGYSNTEIG